MDQNRKAKLALLNFLGISKYDLGKKIGMDLALDHLLVHTVTTDGDATGAKGVEDELKLFYKEIVEVERLADPVHLGQSQFRTGMKAQFSDTMFSGTTVEERRQAKIVFCADVALRAGQIFRNLHNKHSGCLEKIGQALPALVDTVVARYSGCCSERCREYETLCDGPGPRSWWSKSDKLSSYGLRAEELLMNSKDKLILRVILEMKLSKECIKTIRLNTNTQHNIIVQNVVVWCLKSINKKGQLDIPETAFSVLNYDHQCDSHEGRKVLLEHSYYLQSKNCKKNETDSKDTFRFVICFD